MLELSFVGNKEGLLEYLEEEASLSLCCGSTIINGFCSDCKEHA